MNLKTISWNKIKAKLAARKFSRKAILISTTVAILLIFLATFAVLKIVDSHRRAVSEANTVESEAKPERPAPVIQKGSIANPTTPEEAKETGVSKAEVREYNRINRCYLVWNKKVYTPDIAWLLAYPEGQRKIVRYCGKDATTELNKTTASNAELKTSLEKFYLGPLAE